MGGLFINVNYIVVPIFLMLRDLSLIHISRVGGSAQIKAMKKIAAPIRVELAQYRELAAFSQFGSELDASTAEPVSYTHLVSSRCSCFRGGSEVLQ